MKIKFVEFLLLKINVVLLTKSEFSKRVVTGQFSKNIESVMIIRKEKLTVTLAVVTDAHMKLFGLT